MQRKMNLQRARAVALSTLAITLASPMVFAWYRPAFRANRFAVATDNAAASEAAASILRSGGNAVDAAIAAALALGVVSPSSSGFGGGGFAVICQPTGDQCTFIDFRETAPSALTLDVLRRANNPRVSQIGGLAVAVPGEPAGFIEMSRRFGRKPLRAVVAPAVALARRGFVVSPFLAERVGQERVELQRDATLARNFLPSGTAVTAGATLTRPLLAATLDRYGREGERFVHSAFAQAVEQTVRTEGGVLTAQDIVQYRPVERTVLRANFQGHLIVTAPAPSAGGMIVLQALLQYDALLARSMALPEGSSAAHHALIDGWRHGFDDRARYVGDPGTGASVVSSLLDPARLAARHRTFTLERSRAVTVSDPPRDHGTTHLSVIDADGMAVSLTTTVNLAFGARRTVAGMDVVLNDEIDDFSLGLEGNNFALAQSAPNALAAGRRPISSMSPVIVLRDGRPVACVGAGGGPRIATATTQILVELLVHHRSIENAISAPRVHHQGSPEVVLVEPEITEDVRAGLRLRGYTVNESPAPLAVATGVVVGEENHQRVLFAASDPRKIGGAPAGD